MGAVREGRALLQGLVRCGHCGRRMYVNYGGSTANRTLQYRCSKHQKQTVRGEECQLLGGKRIEAKVVEAFLAVAAHAGAEAAELAGDQLRQEIETAERAWGLQIEKAGYEAQRAERQYMAVEPENRTIARELERRWNARLDELDATRLKAAAARRQYRPLTDQELAGAQTLGANLDSVWRASTTTIRDRKRMLQTLINEVQLRTDEKVHRVRIVWKGDATTDCEVVRRRRGSGVTTPQDIIELVQKLAQEFDDAQIARVLHRQGRRTARGLAFTQARVASIRHKHGIPIRPTPKPIDARIGPFNADEVARELGIHTSTVHQWLRTGMLTGQQLAPKAPWRILLTDDVRRRLTVGDAPSGWVSLGEAARRLGISKSLTAYRANQGQLEAVRSKVGKRTCWKINVPEPTSGRQNSLFDQNHISNTEDP